MTLNKTKSRRLTAGICAAFGALVLLLVAGTASATPLFIPHDLTESFCELCGYGYITVIISNLPDGIDVITRIWACG